MRKFSFVSTALPAPPLTNLHLHISLIHACSLSNASYNLISILLHLRYKSLQLGTCNSPGVLTMSLSPTSLANTDLYIHIPGYKLPMAGLQLALMPQIATVFVIVLLLKIIELTLCINMPHSKTSFLNHHFRKIFRI